MKNYPRLQLKILSVLHTDFSQPTAGEIYLGILSLTKTLIHMSSSHKNQLIFDIQRFYTFTMVRELIHAGGDHRITECIGLGGSLGIILSNCLCQATSCNVLQDLLRGHKLILSFFSSWLASAFLFILSLLQICHLRVVCLKIILCTMPRIKLVPSDCIIFLLPPPPEKLVFAKTLSFH